MATLADMQTELAALDAAILKQLTGGSEVEMDGRRIRRPDLSALYARKRELEALIGRVSGERPSLLRGTPC